MVASLRQAQGPRWWRRSVLAVPRSFASSDGLRVVGLPGFDNDPELVTTVAELVEATRGALKTARPFDGLRDRMVSSPPSGYRREHDQPLGDAGSEG